MQFSLVLLLNNTHLNIIRINYIFCCCSVTQLWVTLWYPMNCSMPGLAVLQYLMGLAQTHIHWVSDAIQPSNPLLPSSPPALNLSQYQSLFELGIQSIGAWASTSSSVLPINTQEWSPLGWLVGSPCSPRDSQESSPTPQLKSINSSALSFLYSPALTSLHDYSKNHSFDIVT